MRVDGDEIEVTGDLLQPLTRRTGDLLRLAAALGLLAVVIASSLITRPEWVALERSLSQVLGPLSATQGRLVHVAYGVALMVLPFVILIALLIARHRRLLGAALAAALTAGLIMSIHGTSIHPPHWNLDLPHEPGSVLVQFLDDSRWVAMLAALLTVAGPWLPVRWQRWWWTLLLAFVPVHLAINAVVPPRSVLGLTVGFLVGALVILAVGTPALEVPLTSAVRALAGRGYAVSALTVLRPARRDGLLLLASATAPETGPEPAASTAVLLELYGPHQRSGGVLQQIWHKLRLQPTETAPLHASMRRVVEHRALMSIAIGAVGVANTAPVAADALDRGWSLYAYRPVHGTPLSECADTTPVRRVWESLRRLHDHRITHGDLRADNITVTHDGELQVLFGGFANAEYGANPALRESDIAHLLVTTSQIYDTESAVTAAIDEFGADAVLTASRRLTKSAVPARIRRSVPDAGALIAAIRATVMQHTGADQIEPATITRFTRSQLIQLVLLVALVYVAYPFLSAAPTFASQIVDANWWWALGGLAVMAGTFAAAATALWAAADGLVSWRRLTLMQVGNTFAATTTPAGLGGLALSTRFLQKSGLPALRATAAVTLQQVVQVLVHLTLLVVIVFAAGSSTQLASFVPDPTVLYLVAGAALGLIGISVLVPRLRRWLATSVRPKLQEVTAELVEVIRQPKRLALIVLGDAGTTLGSAVVLWMSIHAFGGTTGFATVAMVTMVAETLASAAPTPGGVGAVEAAVIGALAAFGVPAALGVPATLLYRVVSCWIPVFAGWPVMRWLTRTDLI
ncbi:MAG TPA: flippase-like domain-containing protein [Mycolicibacillus parakoreensis]|nr:flippase-like domain-containing protein [Mycolicibacillus parakoreensis]